MYKINTETNKKYTFIPCNDWITKIIIKDNIFHNDIYEKYDAEININGELIVCNDIRKINRFCKKIISETYDEYLEIIKNHDFKKEQWVYNILDGISEQEKILYRDEKIVIVMDYKWDGFNINKLYLLTFPTDKTIHTLRSLNFSHVDLLKHIKYKTIEIIKQKYNYDNEFIKAFIHYAPQTYHLHIHFTPITNDDANSSVEYSHDLTNVIYNLEIKGDYYQSIILNKRA